MGVFAAFSAGERCVEDPGDCARPANPDAAQSGFVSPAACSAIVIAGRSAGLDPLFRFRLAVGRERALNAGYPGGTQ